MVKTQAFSMAFGAKGNNGSGFVQHDMRYVSDEHQGMPPTKGSQTENRDARNPTAVGDKLDVLMRLLQPLVQFGLGHTGWYASYWM